MTRGILLVLLVLALALGAGVGTAKVLDVLDEKQRVRQALREAAVMMDLDADILEAIGVVESGLRLGAINRAGRDGEHGGAFGPTQITERTARRNGYTGDMLAFTTDEKLAALWTAKLLRPGAQNAEGHVLDHELWTPEEYGAWWNGGALSPSAVPATSSAIGYMKKLADAVELLA